MALSQRKLGVPPQNSAIDWNKKYFNLKKMKGCANGRENIKGY